jgi:hypothetical protein
VGVACDLLGETDVAGRVGGMARSDRSLGFIELEMRQRGQRQARLVSHVCI